MLEKTPDDRDRADVLGDPGQAWPQAADAADIDVDTHAGARGEVERLDAGAVDERVELERDPGRGRR